MAAGVRAGVKADRSVSELGSLLHIVSHSKTQQCGTVTIVHSLRAVLTGRLVAQFDSQSLIFMFHFATVYHETCSNV